MTIEEAKRELDEVRNAIREFESLKTEHEALLSRMTTPSTPISERVTGGIKKDLSDNVVSFVELEDIIRKNLEHWLDTYIRIRERIHRLTDSRHRQILTAYYLEGESITRIADRMGYTLRHASRLKDKAIKKYASCA